MKLRETFFIDDSVVEKVGRIDSLDIYQHISDAENGELSVLFFVNKKGSIVGKINAEAFSGAYNSASIGVSIIGYKELYGG